MKDYVIGLYEKALRDNLSWRDKLLCAKECGYDFLEISIDETDSKLSRLEWSGEERSLLIRDMRETGLPIRSMCLSGHRKYPFGSADAEVRRRSMEIMKKAVELSDDLGVRIIQLAGYDVYYEEHTEESERLFRENLEEAVQIAARHGILLGFETMETPFMNTTEKAMYYVNLINSPYLGVYPDSGNLTNAAVSDGGDVLKDLETGRGHIVALHLKETVPGKFREIPFFSGHVNFPAVTQKAFSMGIRRFVTEMWDVGAPSWKEDIKAAVSEMKRILAASYEKYQQESNGGK
ncbi:MAG: L-ribulose-5-phosphate 3-epimerase [Lachnospiraceae bacterium]|nr:L-ribulose-5-phosphate 3-epimerase [Lachnospiraceae bacterium]